MKNLKGICFLVVFLMIALLQISCKKERFLTTGGNLLFSVDTLTFDTVFTAQGSFTAGFKIYNPSDQKIKISTLRIQGGNASYFHLNVNGLGGNSTTDVEIAGNDSIYVFATVNINPTDQNTPFIVEDKFIATLNGKEFSVPFVAYGQNAYYIVDSVLQTQTWKTDKPYVIMHNALVDSAHTLTIPAGCRIFMHADSRLYVSGTLKAIGTKTDSIIFQGDRLDRKYFANRDFAGEWGGLYFTSTSVNSELDFVVIRNGGSSTRIGDGVAQPAAIQVDQHRGTIQLVINHTIIYNSLGFGILSFGGAIRMENSLIYRCASQALALLQGGTYLINNATFALYSSGGINGIAHSDEPAVVILNYFDINDREYRPGHLSAELNNCIIWGSLENELFCNRKDGANFSLKFNNCIFKSKDQLPAYVDQAATLQNQDPLFEDQEKGNFRLRTASPAIDAGNATPLITTDLDDKPWTSPFDLGCYSKN